MRNAIQADLGEPPRGLLGPHNFHVPLPMHHTYVETRGSRGAWLLHKTPSPLEVLNDLDGDALNLSRVMIDDASRTTFLRRYARQDDIVHAESSGTCAITRAVHFARAAEQAVAAVVPCRHSTSGRRKALSAGLGLHKLDSVFERFRNIQVESGTTAKLIERYDWAQAVFLCDERATVWHDEGGDYLVGSLRRATGKIILVANEVPTAVARDSRWKQVHELRHPGGPVCEAVWTNY